MSFGCNNPLCCLLSTTLTSLSLGMDVSIWDTDVYVNTLRARTDNLAGSHCVAVFLGCLPVRWSWRWRLLRGHGLVTDVAGYDLRYSLLLVLLIIEDGLEC